MADIEKVIKGLECCAKCESCAECCPYDDDNDDFKDCTSKLANDALELLKEQIPRILSKNDILCNCPDYVYMEVKDGWVECCIMDAGESTKDFAYFSYGVTNCFIKNYKDYGRTWRCWTVYPTQEQRKAKPLKDGEQE